MGLWLAEAASRAGAGRTWGLPESLRDELWAQSHPRRLTACSAAAGCWVGPETQPASHLLVSFGPWWEPGLCPRAAARSPGSVSAPARPAQCWVCVQRREPPEASALCSVWRRGDCRGHRGARRFCTCDDALLLRLLNPLLDAWLVPALSYTVTSPPRSKSLPAGKHPSCSSQLPLCPPGSPQKVLEGLFCRHRPWATPSPQKCPPIPFKPTVYLLNNSKFRKSIMFLCQ